MKTYARVQHAIVAKIIPPAQYDAHTMLQATKDQVDAETATASDGGNDGSHAVLRKMGNAIVHDLQTRGGGRFAFATFELNGNPSALVSTHRIYGDAARADQRVHLVRTGKSVAYAALVDVGTPTSAASYGNERIFLAASATAEAARQKRSTSYRSTKFG